MILSFTQEALIQGVCFGIFAGIGGTIAVQILIKEIKRIRYDSRRG